MTFKAPVARWGYPGGTSVRGECSGRAALYAASAESQSTPDPSADRVAAWLPDSVQVSGETLPTRQPIPWWVWLATGPRPAGQCVLLTDQP